MGETRRPCSKCGRNRAERFFKSARARVCADCLRATRRKHARKRRVGEYGITPEEYAALFEAQGGKCAICFQPRTYHLNIDHDHRIEREFGTRRSVRGLLCRRCNKLLAVAGDNATILMQAVRYLRNPIAHEIIEDREVH